MLHCDTVKLFATLWPLIIYIASMCARKLLKRMEWNLGVCPVFKVDESSWHTQQYETVFQHNMICKFEINYFYGGWSYLHGTDIKWLILIIITNIAHPRFIIVLITLYLPILIKNW